MDHLKLTRKEADTLELVKAYLESKIASLRKDGVLFPSEMNAQVSLNNIESFLRRREDYNRRWLKYKNQIFGILNLDDWLPSTDKWIERICPSNSSEPHHLLDLSSLRVFTHNLLATQYPHVQDTNTRMCRAILREQGYIEGNATIKELFEEETNTITKEVFKKHIEAFELLQPYRDYLVACVRKVDYPKNLLDWIDSQNLSVEKAYDILTELGTAIYYLKDFAYSNEIEDKLDDVLEVLWKRRKLENSG